MPPGPAPVAVAQLLAFLVDIKRFAGLSPEHHVHRFLLVAIKCLDGAGLVYGSIDLIQLLKQIDTTAHARGVPNQIPQNRWGLNLGLGRTAKVLLFHVQLKRIIRGAKISRALITGIQVNALGCGQANIGRHANCICPLHARHARTNRRILLCLRRRRAAVISR